MLDTLETRARGLAERPDGVALVGRGLMRRWLVDPALRWTVERTRR